MGSLMRRTRIMGLAMASAVLFSACTPGTGSAIEEVVTETEVVTQAEPATGDATSRFLACLANADVTTWLSVDDGSGVWTDGVIYVYSNPDPTDQGTALVEPNAGLGVLLDTTGTPTGRIGTWVAPVNAASFADPTLADAWGNCEQQNPDFAQPEIPELDEFSPEVQEGLARQMNAGLEFAQCGRDNGYAWLADPDPEGSGDVVIPAQISEEEFAALLDDCYDEDETDGNLGISFETGIVCYGTPIPMSFGGFFTRNGMLNNMRQARASQDPDGSAFDCTPFAPKD